MTLPAWPATVPLIFRREVTNLQQVSAVAETEMESGPPRQRVIDAETWTATPVRLRLTSAQYDAFEDWWRATLGRGMSRFTASVSRPTGASISRTCFIAGGAFATAIQGPWIMVSFDLRVLNYHD